MPRLPNLTREPALPLLQLGLRTLRGAADCSYHGAANSPRGQASQSRADAGGLGAARTQQRDIESVTRKENIARLNRAMQRYGIRQTEHGETCLSPQEIRRARNLIRGGVLARAALGKAIKKQSE